MGNSSIVLDYWKYFGQQWQHEGLPGLRLGAGEAFGTSGHVGLYRMAQVSGRGVCGPDRLG
jgi:hypothetical protein